jgi:hypothetical protein
MPNHIAKLLKTFLRSLRLPKHIARLLKTIFIRSLPMTNPIVANRLKAFKNQSGRCYYCESMMWLDKQEDFAAKHNITVKEAARFKCTAEHLVARCDGGGNGKSNIVASCLFCNGGRHRRQKPPAPNHYRELIKKRLKKGKWFPESLRHLASRPR